MSKILVTGALGQIGSELSTRLAEIYGKDAVIISDIKNPEDCFLNLKYEQLDVQDIAKWKAIIQDNQITEVYHLAAMLSATAEKYPMRGWDLNTDTYLQLLEMAKELGLKKIFWPSSIAVFGRGAQKDNTPQESVRNPLSLYGIAKVAGEGFSEIYHTNFGLDIRSIRYPGLISWKTPAGGGTTDYAVEIFYEALEHKKYTCFLSEDTPLPMMYMDDAIRATVELMQAPKENLSVHTSYNLNGITFTPAQIAKAIQAKIPDFKIEYKPDYRQKIVDSWPHSVDDTKAQQDWNWKTEFDLDELTQEMLQNLSEKLQINY